MKLSSAVLATLAASVSAVEVDYFKTRANCSNGAVRNSLTIPDGSSGATCYKFTTSAQAVRFGKNGGTQVASGCNLIGFSDASCGTMVTLQVTGPSDAGQCYSTAGSDVVGSFYYICGLSLPTSE
ncbi:uncharacterized protein LTR77_000606 [Saxophila tyrrhenica]|uniref:Uncharacterized protein n=1 Tax=Saxophila tyrrhenica TaxID=1690608 RepID=A0AAV9PRN4_9PEZI|nr:hypothetical protein LTR77_000606 [Saxophila tyrrhenica]